MYTDKKQSIQQSRTIQQRADVHNLFTDRRPVTGMPSIQRVSIDYLKGPRINKNGEKEGVIKKQYPSIDSLQVDFLLAKFAVKKMLKEYKINKDIDALQIKLLEKEEFALYNCYNNYYDFLKGKGISLGNLKVYIVKNAKEFLSWDFVLNNYGGDLAFAGTVPNIKNTVFINKSQEFQGGVHTIIHEIMHLLANEKIVKILRTEENPNGDEAMNEIVARIASLNVDGSIANWNTDMEVNGHDGSTLYGGLIRDNAKLKEFKGRPILDLLKYYLQE